MFFIILLLFDCVSAKGNVYISKRDIDTNQYVLDCDFLLYDNTGNVIDAWKQEESSHLSSLDIGEYKLVERSLFNDDFSHTYDLSIKNDEVYELVLYNSKIDVPDNLGVNSFNYFGLFFIFAGILCILTNCFFWKFSFH